MKNNISTTQNKEIAIVNCFRMSGLKEEQFLTACKQYAFALRTDLNFKSLSTMEKENYLRSKNLFGVPFLGNINLIEVLNELDNISLVQIYSYIVYFCEKSEFKIDIKSFLRNKNNILIATTEQFFSLFLELYDLEQNITLWVSRPLLAELLKFDLDKKSNIKIKQLDMYSFENEEIQPEKFDFILNIPVMGARRKYEKGRFYGNDTATVAAEILFENNLTKNGTLYTIMPHKINFAESEVHFRQKYQNHLHKIHFIEAGTFSYTSIKTYAYEFKHSMAECIEISGIEEGKARLLNIEEILTPDLRWDFEKPFREEDIEIASILKQNHNFLSDVADIVRGKPLPKYAKEAEEDFDFSYIDMKSLRDDFIDYSSAKKYILDKDFSNEFLQKDDILIQAKGNSSKIAIYNGENKNCVASANLIVIRPKKNIILTEYLYHYLKSDLGQKLIKEKDRGTTLQFINHDDLKSIPIIIPTIEKQNIALDKYKKSMKMYVEQISEIQTKITNTNIALCKMFSGQTDSFCLEF